MLDSGWVLLLLTLLAIGIVCLVCLAAGTALVAIAVAVYERRRGGGLHAATRRLGDAETHFESERRLRRWRRTPRSRKGTDVGSHVQGGSRAGRVS
jgi:hypothetical protein